MVLEVQNKSIDTWEQVAQEIASLKQSITTEQEIVEWIKKNFNLAVDRTNDNLTKLQWMVKESLSTTEESLLPNADKVSSGVSSIEYPELTNKKLMEFDAGLSAIQSPWFSEFRISNKIDQKKLSAEQLKNLAAFDKVQASMYIMLCNANKRDLPAPFLMKASVAMAKDLFDHMGDGKSGSWFDLSKITNWAKDLAYNKTIWAWVWELKKGADWLVKSFTESWAADMLWTAQAWLSMVNDLPDVTSKWNNFLWWIADGDLTGVDLTKSTMPAIYTVYQSCKSGYPSTEKTQWLNVAWDDADWISKNSGKMLSTNAMVLGNLNDHTEELIKSIINPKNQKSLNEFVNKSEWIIDTMIEKASTMWLSSDVFESMMSSWGKRFEKFAFIGRMLWVDMSPLISTLNAKLSPKQEQQLTAFLKNYQPSTTGWPHPWEEYISDDPESKKQSVILTINIWDITKWLLVMTPAASVVSQFVWNDETKKAIYFDKDEKWALTVLKDWSKVSNDDKKALIDGYIGNEDVVKDLLQDVTGAEGDAMRIVGRSATWYMRWPRGKKFYDNYHKEHTNNKKKVEEKIETTSETERQHSDAILAENNKVKAKDTWKQYGNEALFKLPTDIKYDFAVARLLWNYPTSSMTVAEELVMKIASEITVSPLSTKEIAANIWLWFDGIAYGETGLDMSVANKEIQDLSQKAKWLFGRSVDKDPDWAIAKDIKVLKNNTWWSTLISKIDAVQSWTSEYYVLSYIWYLIDRTNVVRWASWMYGNSDFKPFSVLANMNNYCDGKLWWVDELDKQIKYYFQWANHEKWKTWERACQYVRSSLWSQITK